jgi:hypothetical protein
MWIFFYQDYTNFIKYVQSWKSNIRRRRKTYKVFCNEKEGEEE